VISTSAPLLQRWFASSGHPSAADPYFLYAASNLGSMVSLISYPFLIEPFFPLAVQGGAWMAGYVLLVLLLISCGRLIAAQAGPAAVETAGGAAPGQAPSEQIIAHPQSISFTAERSSSTAAEENDAPAVPAAADAPAPSSSGETAKQPAAGGTAEVPSGKGTGKKWKKQRQKPTPPAPVEEAIQTGRRPGPAAPPVVEMPPLQPLTWSRQLAWIGLAFVPCSLMLGVTLHMTTDIAAIPLFWLVPLTIYLLSFILVFSKTTARVHPFMVLAMPVMVLLLVFMRLSDTSLWFGWMFLIDLLALFAVAMLCHGELARGRPHAEHLTRYFLCLSIGGVLGGMFNAFIAPNIFSSVVEYPLVMALSCFCVPLPEEEEESATGWWVDIGLAGVLAAACIYVGYLYVRDWSDAAAFGVIERAVQLSALKPVLLHYLVWIGLPAALLVYVVRGDRSQRWVRLLDVVMAAELGFIAARFVIDSPLRHWEFPWLRSIWDVSRERVADVFTATGLIAVAYGFTHRPVRFGLAVAALWLIASAVTDTSHVIYQERSFFGINRVEAISDSEGRPQYHRLLHGTTLHGMQRRDGNPWSVAAFVSPLAADHPLAAVTQLAAADWTILDRRSEPLTYFHRTGPIGEFFDTMVHFPDDRRPIAVLGLGTGTLAGYAVPRQKLTFFEIDPVAVAIAENPRYFTYLQDCRLRGADYEIKLGDGRLKIGQEQPGTYHILFMDAFSSDSVPVHLITREAIKMYFDKLAPDGVVVVNISNRYLDLTPVLGNIARNLGLVGVRQYDDYGVAPEKFSSHWVVMARNWEALRFLASGPDLLRQEIEVNALLGMIQPNGMMLPAVHQRWQNWQPLEPDPSMPLWTDDFSNLLSIIKR
jgi:spermidine synthase